MKNVSTVLVVSFKIIWRGVANRICNAQLAQQLDCVLRDPRCDGLIVSLKVFNFSSSRNTKLCNISSIPILKKDFEIFAIMKCLKNPNITIENNHAFETIQAVGF